MQRSDLILIPASLVGVVVGVMLLVGSATATTAVRAPLPAAPLTPRPTPVTTTTTTTAAPSTTATSGATAATVAPFPSATTIAATIRPPPSRRDAVVAFALAQRGRPYRRGAAGPSAYDCSGLTSAAYAAVGVELPRYSVAQAALGRPVDWRRDGIEPGDLVFTRGDTPEIDLGHVGLAISASEWVVASRPGLPVRVAPLPAHIQRVRRLLAA